MPGNILWARPCPKPEFIPNSRPKGARATGLRYERRFYDFMRPYGCIHAQWFEYEDQFGVHYCQPDILMPFTKYLMAVIEVKYTLVDKAYDQLYDLYKPVVEAAFNIPVGLVVVFRNFPPRKGERLALSRTIKEAAIQSQETGGIGLVQWVGQPVVARLDDRTAGLLAKIRQQAA